MRPTVEERLARAGRTLDAATDARVSMDPSPSGVHAAAGGASRKRQLSGAAAAVVAVVVIGVAVLAVRSGSDSDPATGAGRVSAAVDATRSAAAMAVDLYGEWSFAPDGAEGIWNYGAPDRWEQLAQSDQPRVERNPPGGASVRLYVGDRTWTVSGEGGWQEELPSAAAQPDPLRMLDQLAGTDCAVDVDGQLVAWRSAEGVCPGQDAGVPSDLPIGTWVWALILDENGRLREVRTGEVGDLGDDVQLDSQRDPLARVGALRGGSARFWYDNVSEVSAEPSE
jgi:hypothetical protein